MAIWKNIWYYFNKIEKGDSIRNKPYTIGIEVPKEWWGIIKKQAITAKSIHMWI